MEIHRRYLRTLSPRSTGGAEPRSPFGVYRHYLVEMTLLPWLVLERFGTKLYRRDAGPVTGGLTRSFPERSVRLPVRAGDVTEAFVAYMVPARTVRALLSEQGVPLVPIDLGRGRTVVELFGARYRISDLGTYDEVGLAFLVAPRGDPLAVGLYYFELTATTRFSCEVARTIWGVVKHEEQIDVTLGDARATWRLPRKGTGAEVLTLTVPRGGGGSSTAIPIWIYSMLNGRLHRARSLRTGRGERIRFDSGGVSLTVATPEATGADPLADALRRLDLVRAPILAHGWTEHMSGELGPPRPL